MAPRVESMAVEVKHTILYYDMLKMKMRKN